MILPQAVVVALLALVSLIWLYRCYLIHQPRARGPVLNARSYGDVGDQGLVSVIMPAKDEEDNVREALATVLAQDYRRIEVIVVNDRSTDRTAARVREVMATDPRVRLVEVQALPPGWFGKPHAMYTGAKEARGNWLLFVDMDCRQAPHSVRAAVGMLVEHRGDMLSLWPVLEMHSFWENALLPVLGSVLVAWFRPTWVNDPKRRTAFANGQYILIRRSVYEAVGGLESVRTEIVEDIALARVVKGAGHRLLNAIGDDLFTTRMYTSLRGIWRGWTRIYYGGFKRVGVLLLVMLMTLILTLVPFGTLAASAVATALGAGGTFSRVVLGTSLAIVVMIVIVMRRYFLLGRGNPWYLLCYPVAVLITLGIQACALARALGLGSLTWRGTTYKQGKVVGGDIGSPNDKTGE